MPKVVIDVFISHSWSYSRQYQRLSEWIFQEWDIDGNSVRFRNYSIPATDRVHTNGTDADLRRKIAEQIRQVSVVVIPTGMYVNYSKWIKKEIDISVEYGKPILAVNPWGQERASLEVKNVASDEVGWNSVPIVRSIYNLGMAQR
jgi:hypothetical protein